MRSTLLSLTCVLMSSAAWGQATPEGAADLTALFQKYLGNVPGVVTVAVDGDAYAVTLDAAPMIAMVPPEAGATVTLSPVEMSLTDNGDGTWDVAQDQPLSFSLSVPGQVEMNVAIASVVCEGIYDTALMASNESLCTLTDMTMDQKINDPSAGQSEVTYKLAEMTYEASAVAGAAGGIDGTVSYVATGIEQVMTMPMAPGAPPVPLRIAIDQYNVDGTSSGLRPAAFLDLIAWVVAHPSEAAMTADKAGVKAILEQGLPFFDRIDADGTLAGIAIESPVGPIGIRTLGFDVSMGGAVSDGLFREAFRFEGVTPPPGVLPPFAADLLPDRFGIDVTVSSFDAAAAAKLLIGLLDLPDGAEPGPEFGMTLLQAVIPDGSVDITLAPGEVANAVYTLTYEGTMTAGPGSMPTGTAKVTATGYDTAMSILDGAPDEMKSGVLPAMGMARGLAKQGPDGLLTWEIDATQPGTLMVNGMDLMGMQ